ncbi:MAG: translation initiation factor IF-3 [Patescibacteria group bacterium]
MRIHYRRRGGPQKKEESVQYNINEQITVPEVRVIDDKNAFLGVMPTDRALAIAQERELDLVEVSPKENPPVCKILDYGQFKYHKEKEQRAQKAHAKKIDVKGIRLSVKMGQNDFDIRLNKAKEFFKDGDKVKIEIMLRGREKEHGHLAQERIKAFIDQIALEYGVTVEQPITRSGGNVSAIIARKA